MARDYWSGFKYKKCIMCKVYFPRYGTGTWCSTCEGSIRKARLQTMRDKFNGKSSKGDTCK